MNPSNDFRSTTTPDSTDAPDESLRKIVALLHSASVPNTEAPSVALDLAAVATTLAAAGLVLHPKTRRLTITVETAVVRFCPDGTTPTATLGHPIAAGAYITISRAEALAAKWISASASKLQISQYLY